MANNSNNNEFVMPEEAGANEPVLVPVVPAPANASARANRVPARANRVSARANRVSAHPNRVSASAAVGGRRKKHTRRHKKAKRTRRHRKH